MFRFRDLPDTPQGLIFRMAVLLLFVAILVLAYAEATNPAVHSTVLALYLGLVAYSVVYLAVGVWKLASDARRIRAASTLPQCPNCTSTVRRFKLVEVNHCEICGLRLPTFSAENWNVCPNCLTFVSGLPGGLNRLIFCSRCGRIYCRKCAVRLRCPDCLNRELTGE